MIVTLTGNAEVDLKFSFVKRIPDPDKPNDIYYDVAITRDASQVKGGTVVPLATVYLVPSADILKLEKYLGSMIVGDGIEKH